MATKTNRLWAIAALVLVGTSFTACLKSVDTTPSRAVAGISIINGIVSSTGLDFFDNSTTKATASKLPMGFGDKGYLIYGGLHEFSFTKTGTLSPVIATTSPRQYDSTFYYTLVTYGDSAHATVVSFKEDFSSAVSTKLNIRFFNLSPTATPVDLYLGDVKVDSNLAYIGNTALSTSFKPQSVVSGASTIRIKAAGSTLTSPSIAETSTANLMSGGIYTIFLAGMKDSAGPLKPQVKYVPSFY